MSLSLSTSLFDLARRHTSDVLTRIQSHLTSSTLSPLTAITLTWFSQQLQRVHYILQLLQLHPHRGLLGILCITGGIMSMRWIIRHVIINKIQDEKKIDVNNSPNESVMEIIASSQIHRHNNNAISMNAVSTSTSSSSISTSSSVSTSSPSASRHRICHFYNRSRGCRLGATCDHLHICKICRSTQHQAYNCTYPRLAAAASNHGVTFAILSSSPSTSTSTSASTFTLPSSSSSSSASVMSPASTSTSTSTATVTPTRFSQSTPLLPWPTGIPPFKSHTTPKSSRTSIDSSQPLLSTPIPPAASDVPMPSFLHTTAAAATTTAVATSTTSSSPFSSPCLSSSCPCGGPYARSLREHSCHEHPTFGCRHLRHYYKLYEQLLHTHQEDESRHIEWKHVGKLRNLKETAVKYVIAMGNAEGGVLKFGIDEKSDRVFGISFSSRYRMTKEDVRRELSSTMKQFTNTQPNGYHLVFVPVVDDHIRIRSSSTSTIPPLLDDDSSSDDTDHKSGTDGDHDEPEHLIDEYGKYTRKTYICPCTQKSIDGISIPLTSLSCGCPCRCSCRCRYVLEIHIRPSPYALYMHGTKKNVLETYLYADAGVHTYTNESVHLFIHNHAMRRQLQQSFNYQALLQRAQELVTSTSTATSTYENEEKQQTPSSPHITPSRELTRIQQQHLNVMSPPTSTHTIRMITGPIPTPTKTIVTQKKKKTKNSPVQTNTSKINTLTPSETIISTSNSSSTSSSPTMSPVSSPSTSTRDLTYSPSQSSNITSSPSRSRLPRSHRLRSRLIRSNMHRHKPYRISIVFLFFMILIIVMPITLFYYRPDPLSSSSFFEHEGDFYGMCPAEQEQIITINHTSDDVPFFIAAPTESTIVVGRCIHPRLLYQSPIAVTAPDVENSTTDSNPDTISSSSTWFHSLRTLVDHLFQLFQSPSQ